jgi:hypothetical protein
MNTTNPADIPQMIRTLEHIEILALRGTIPGTLTALTARLLATELAHSNNESETLERANIFVLMCQQNTLQRAS